MKNHILVTVVVGTMLLAGCQNAGTKQTVGGLGGAVVGGLAGSQIGGGTGQLVAVGVGTLLGAWAGSEIGASLDRADQAYANQAAQRAFEYSPSGSSTSWRNPDSGNYGTVMPTGGVSYQSDGQPCRPYSQTIYVDGRQETATGTACRRSDNTWHVVG